MKDDLRYFLREDVIMIKDGIQSFPERGRQKTNIRARKALALKLEQDFARFQIYKDALLKAIGNEKKATNATRP